MVTLFSKLPTVVINKILTYTNVIKYRNGKYMDTIPPEDIRYTLLSKTLKPIRNPNSDKYFTFELINKKTLDWNGYLLTYFLPNNTNNNNCHLLNIQRLTRVNNGYDKYYVFGKKNSYIFSLNNKWERIVDYTM